MAFKQITGIKELGLRLWKKTHALLFPYIAFAGIYCFFFKKDFVHLLSVGGAEYWFMYVLFLLTVFFLLYEQVVKNIKNPYLYVLAWVTPYAMLLFIQHSVWRNVYMGGCVINQLVAYYRFYLLGYLCKKYKSINNLIFYNKYVYAIGFVAFFVRWYWSQGLNMFISMMGIMGAIIVLQHFFVTCTNTEGKSLRLLSYIGQNSLEIYLLQYFFLPDLSSFIQPYINVSNGFIWQLCLALILTIPITATCIFVGNLIKKNQILSWILLGK